VVFVKANWWQRLNQKWSSWTDSLPLSLALFMKAIPLLLVWATIPFLALLCSGLGQLWLVQADLSDRTPQPVSTKITDPTLGELTFEVIYSQQIRLDTPMLISLWLLLPEGDILDDPIPDYLLTIQATNALEAVHFSSFSEGTYSTQYRLTPTQRGMPPTVIYAHAGQKSSYWTPVSTSAALTVSGPVTASLTLENMQVEGQMRSQWRRAVQFLTGTNALVLVLLTAVFGFTVQQWRYLADLDQAQKKGKLEAARQEITWLASQLPKNPSQVLRRYLELKEKTDFPWTDPQIRAQLEGIWDQSAPKEAKLLAQILPAAISNKTLADVTQKIGDERTEIALIWGLQHLDDYLRSIIRDNQQLFELVSPYLIEAIEKKPLHILLDSWSVSAGLKKEVQASSFREQLRLLIGASFSNEELKTLTFDLNVNFEDLSGSNRMGRIRSLIAGMERANRIEELLDKVKMERPELDWDTLLAVVPDRAVSLSSFSGQTYGKMRQGVVGHHQAENDLLLFRTRLDPSQFDNLSSGNSNLIFGADGSGKTASALFLAYEQWQKWEKEVFFPIYLPVAALSQPERFLKEQVAPTLAMFLLKYLAVEPRHFLDLRQRQAAIARLWGHYFGEFAHVRLLLYEAGLPDFGFGQHFLDRLGFLMGDCSFSGLLSDESLIELISSCYPADFTGLLFLLDWQPDRVSDALDRIKKYLSMTEQLNRRGGVVKFFLPSDIKQPLLADLDLNFFYKDGIIDLEWNEGDLKSLLERRLQLQKDVSVLEELCNPDARALKPQQRLLEKAETPGKMIYKVNKLLANLDDDEKLTTPEIESWLKTL
jgi:hypothetical protein